jgi:hypothetical protein
MSVYERSGSPFWQYEFEVAGVRFRGSTRAADKRQATTIERQKRDEAREEMRRVTESGAGPMTLNAAFERYWIEHVANALDLDHDLARLLDYLGRDTLLTDITDDDVAKMVAWRRTHYRWDNPKHGLITPSQVNRSSTEVLRRVLTRAKNLWRINLPNSPQWGRHLLGEPEERVRELREDENSALSVEIDPEYELVRRFSLCSGLRQVENLLEWSQVDLNMRRITRKGKGGTNAGQSGEEFRDKGLKC